MEDYIKALVPAWTIVIFFVLRYFYEHPPSGLMRWVGMGRRREKLTLINEQLRESTSLSPEARAHFEGKKERLLFEELEGISADPRLIQKLIAALGNQPGKLKLSLSQIKPFIRHLTLDEKGNLTVQISKIRLM